MTWIARVLPSGVCIMATLAFLYASMDSGRALADDPKPDLSKECKFALLVGFGKGKNEEETAVKGQAEIKETLISGWGFPSAGGFMHTKTNGNATKKDIERDLEDIEKALDARDPKKVDNCVVKIHFQGHGSKGKPGDDKGVTPPDNNDDHVGFDTAGGEHFWDFELVKHLQKLNEIMKKKNFKRQAVLVQIDMCYAQGLVGKLAKETPANMNFAWSSGKSSGCSAELQPGEPTPFTKGFINAFGGEKPPTAEEAHKKATEVPGLKNFNPGTKDGEPGKPKIIK
jgi:Caspase domain